MYWLLPAFRRKKIDEITRAEVARFHHQLGMKFPYQANRCKEQLARMFNLAKTWMLLPDSLNDKDPGNTSEV